MNISEVPENLQNFYFIFDHQADKLSVLLQMLNKNLESSRIIIFFSTCASVNFYFPVLKYLFSDDVNKHARAEIFKLHGKIDQRKRSKIYR